MKKSILLGVMLTVASLNMHAQIGTPFIHDPSTIVVCDGKYYTFGTGEGGLVSTDGWHWTGGGVRPGGGVAPDVIKIGDRYLVTYAVGGGGLAGGHASKVMTMWNKTLDPASPDFKYSDPVEVASSDYDEDCDAIDPAFLMGPDGRLWLSYGTYFGFIRLVELDPTTGKRMEGNQPRNIAIDCEATAMMYRDGWYYLLATHGTCCDGPNSTYNIVVGRSRDHTSTTSVATCSRVVERWCCRRVAERSVLATSVASSKRMAWRRCRATTKQTCSRAAIVCSVFFRSSGRMAGPWQDVSFVKAPARSHPCAGDIVWSSPLISPVWRQASVFGEMLMRTV